MEDDISNSFHVITLEKYCHKTRPKQLTFSVNSYNEDKHSVMNFSLIDPNVFYVNVNDDNDGMNKCQCTQ